MMAPETREGLLRAAQACADAGVQYACDTLQWIADDPTADDATASEWLWAASFGCWCCFRIALERDADAAKPFADASHVCLMERFAAAKRRFGVAA
jgi:hypothetical protein